MNVNPELIASVVAQILAEDSAKGAGEPKPVPVGISNRHIHLSRKDLDTLFGEGYELTPLKDLSQPGQYACKELVTIVGPSLKPITNVRVLGPIRKETQVEISRTDSFVLKVKPPVRESGSLEGSAPIMVVGPKGVINLDKGCIIANRHIHMSLEDGAAYGLNDGDYVDVEVQGERRTKFYDVQVRVNKAFCLEMHVDTDDANAAGLKNGDIVTVVKR